MKKTICHNTYLKAQGLFHLANENYRRAAQFESALSKLLDNGDDYIGHISDQVFEEGGSLDRALKLEGIKVLQQPNVKKGGE